MSGDPPRGFFGILVNVAQTPARETGPLTPAGRSRGWAIGITLAAATAGPAPIGAWQDRVMGVDVTTSTTIARPLHAVAAYAADPSNAPEWYAKIASVEWRTPQPVGKGSQLDFVAHFLGRRLAYTYEVVEHDPPARMIMRTASGPFPMETTYTWTAEGDGATRMTLRNRGTPAGFSKLVAPFLSTAVRRANRKDLARLKAILER